MWKGLVPEVLISSEGHFIVTRLFLTSRVPDSASSVPRSRTCLLFGLSAASIGYAGSSDVTSTCASRASPNPASSGGHPTSENLH